MGMAIKMRNFLQLPTLAYFQNLARDPIDVFPTARHALMLSSYWIEYDMYLPKYLKLLVKVTNPPFTLMIDVSLHLVYSSYSRVCLFFSLYFLWRARVELLRSVIRNVCALKKPGGGKNTH